jgi:hypothetical protein
MSDRQCPYFPWVSAGGHGPAVPSSRVEVWREAHFSMALPVCLTDVTDIALLVVQQLDSGVGDSLPPFGRCVLLELRVTNQSDGRTWVARTEAESADASQVQRGSRSIAFVIEVDGGSSACGQRSLRKRQTEWIHLRSPPAAGEQRGAVWSRVTAVGRWIGSRNGSSQLPRRRHSRACSPTG